MCGKVGVDDVGLYLGERWCLILVAKLAVGWMMERDLYSHQEQWGQQICWHGDEFWDSHKGAGGIRSRSGEILMYHSLEVFHGISICAHLIFVGLYLQGGACSCLFTLCALSLGLFTLVCTCSASWAVNLCLFDFWLGFVTTSCDTCKTKSGGNDKSYISVRYYSVWNKTYRFQQVILLILPRCLLSMVWKVCV